MNKKITAGVVAVVILGGAFYGGIAYGKSATPAPAQFGNGAGGQFAMNRGTGNGGTRFMTGGFTAGEIISKDASGVTIKMQDGSTKIIFVATSTQVVKTASGTVKDLSIGTNVTVTGAANSDGSITAQSVQIRPQGAMVNVNRAN